MKISKAQFIDALGKNAGIPSRTARWIEKTYGITYSRYDVWKRKKLLPREIIDQIEAESLEEGESALRDCLEQKTDLAVKLRAATFLLSTKGRHLGYGERVDLIPPSEPIRIIVVDNSSKDA